MNVSIESYGLLIASLAVAAAVASATWTLLQILFGPRGHVADLDTFETERLSQLRRSQPTFRWFEPLIRELACRFDPAAEKMRQLQRHLELAQETAPWTPSEFLATKYVEAVLCAAAIYLLIAPTGFQFLAILLAVCMLFGYAPLVQSSVIARSAEYRKRMRLRLPFAIDQIALMLQAGAEFDASVETVVRDNTDHPLTIELSEVLRQIRLGRPRAQALGSFADKLQDNDVSELVFAINKGEELGTPISAILREQADQMRLKRSQWAEQAANEAEVKMVFPGMVVMVACLLVIIAPILLPPLMTFLE